MQGADSGDRNGGEAYADVEGKVDRTCARADPAYLAPVTAPAGAPNVVIVLVDNMGYSNIGCFGSEIPTPHLDRLTEERLRMNNFHMTPICSPPRACPMTGLNAHVAGIGRVIEGRACAKIS
jgi:Sulfatase